MPSPRARLVGIAIAVLVPCLALLLLGAGLARGRAHRAAERHAIELARLAALRQEAVIDAARDLLTLLSTLPSVQGGSPEAASALLARVVKGDARYVNVGVLSTDGSVIASGQPMKGPMSLADRPYFQRAVRGRCFAIGDYQVGRLTDTATMNVALPMLDAAGNVTRVVYAAVDLAEFHEAARRMALPMGSAVMLLDPAGTVAAWVPARANTEGHAFRDLALVKAMLAEPVEGSIEAPGVDGATRLFGFAPVTTEGGDGAPRVAVGLPMAEVDEGIVGSVWIALGGGAVIAVLAFALAWAWGRT